MSRSWRQIQVTVPAGLAEDVRLLMQRRAGRAVAVEDEFAKDPPDESRPTGSCLVTAWFPASDQAAPAADALLADLQMAAGLDVPSLRSVRQSVTDRRQWRDFEAQYQRPVRVQSLLILPAGVESRCEIPSEQILTIDAAGAFGSGLHASTRGALRALQALDLGGLTVLDVGTGTGILAIAAARLGASCVMAIDSDADAVALARRNVRRNGCESVVSIGHAGIDANWLRGRARFDLVVANITADTHRRLLPAYSRAAAGELLLAGIYRPRVDELLDTLRAARWTCRSSFDEGDWATVHCGRSGARRDKAS